MSGLKVGDSFPDDVVFKYIPYTEEKADFKACGVPINYNASKEWANKKVVLFAVPGAFTPTCSAYHLPGYIDNLDKFKAKGVDVIAVVAFNDPFVMSAWGKANGIKDDSILFLTDPEIEFTTKLGWASGGRTGRWAIVIDNGKIIYAEKEPAPGLTVSGADAVLAKI